MTASGRPEEPSRHRLDQVLSGMPEPPAPGTPPAAILEAARSLFAERGFAGTSTRAIATAAGVNLAMIHYYFGNKEQLYQRVVKLELGRFFRIIGDGLGNLADPHDVLSALPGFIIAMQRERPGLSKLILREMLDGAPRIPAVVRDMGENGPLGLRGVLFRLIEVAQGGTGHGLPPAHLLAVIFSIGHGLMVFAPLITEVFGLDMGEPRTAEAVATTAGTVIRRTLTPGQEA
jgi:AcrR family transcriptional regulator